MSVPHPDRARAVRANPRSGLLAQAVAFAPILDIAEGRRPGHAARVAVIARALTAALGPVGRYLPDASPAELQHSATLAGLLHDVGVPLAPRPPDPAENRPQASAQRPLRQHVHAAEDLLAQSCFPAGLAGIVAAGHENWDGSGDPRAQAGERIPALARVLRAADLLEAAIAAEPNPFRARARAPRALARWRGREIDPLVASALDRLLVTDDFWLRLHDDALQDDLLALPAPAADASAPHPDWRFDAAVATLIDRKAAHAPGRVLCFARSVRALAGAVLLDPAATDRLTRAALWNDVGLLALPQDILALPDLLSLEQMQAVHRHPRLSADVVAALPGLHEAANWVVAHHERRDGKGYPDGLRGAEIPLPAAVLSLADAYIAMRAARPHRPARSDHDALQTISRGAGPIWPTGLVQAFLALHREQRLSVPLPID